MPRLTRLKNTVGEAALEITDVGEQEELVVEQPAEGQEQQPQQSEPVEQPKRKRGRPKKVRPSEETEPQAAEQPKKRGRPKKVKTEEPVEQPKRKRGRPKKVKADPDTEAPAVLPDPETLDLFPESAVTETQEAAPEPPAGEEPAAPETAAEPQAAEEPEEQPSEEVSSSDTPETPSEAEPVPTEPAPTESAPAESASQEEFSLKYDTNSGERYVDSTSLKTQFEKVLEELAKISKDMLSWEVDKFTDRFTKKYVGEGMTLEEANSQKFEAFLGGFITNAAMELYDRGYKDAAFHKLEQAINVLEARKKLEDEVESIKTRNEEDVVDLSDMLGLFVGDA